MRASRFHNASNAGHQGQCGSNTHAPAPARQPGLCAVAAAALNCAACRKTTSQKVLNWSDKWFSCTFWNRVVKLSIHEHFAPPTDAVARTLRSHPRAFAAPHEPNVRGIVLGNETRNGGGEKRQTRHMHFLVCDISAPRQSGEQSEEKRLTRTAASDADLPLLAS